MKIVVPTCRSYWDAAVPFLHLLERFWPNHPETIVVVGSGPGDQAVATSAQILAVDDQGFSSNTLGVLHAIATINPNEPVLLLQEDFFLTEPVDEDYIKECEDILRHDATVACIRLYPCPGADHPWKGKTIGIIDQQADYRVSCQATMWRCSELVATMREGEDPTAYELSGTARCRNDGRLFLGWLREAKIWPIHYICSAISRGEWEPGALEWCRTNGIDVCTSRVVRQL